MSVFDSNVFPPAAKPAKKPVARYLAHYSRDSDFEEMSIEAKSDRAAARIAASYELGRDGCVVATLTGLSHMDKTGFFVTFSGALDALALEASHWDRKVASGQWPVASLSPTPSARKPAQLDLRQFYSDPAAFGLALGSGRAS